MVNKEYLQMQMQMFLQIAQQTKNQTASKEKLPLYQIVSQTAIFCQIYRREREELAKSLLHNMYNYTSKEPSFQYFCTLITIVVS